MLQIVCVCALLSCFADFCTMGQKYTKIVGGDGANDPRLYLGSIDWVIEDEILDDLGICAIVSVLPHRPQYVDQVLQKHGIAESDYLVYPLEDSMEEYISIFEMPDIFSVCEFINARLLANKSVLVHCDAGITRSPSVVVSYLMKYGTDLDHPRHLSLFEAATIVHQLRERMDICVFNDELGRLEAILEGMGDRPTTPSSSRNLPRTPRSPKSWEMVKEKDDPRIELEILRATWKSIREGEGGQKAFGTAVYKHLYILGGNRYSHAQLCAI